MIFGGRNLFGMGAGSQGRHKKRRTFTSPSNAHQEETVEPSVAGCESRPGELKRRTVQAGDSAIRSRLGQRLMGGRNLGAPRVGGIKLHTK